MERVVLSNRMINELREIELNLLRDFAKVCDDNQLKYYLMYGSLLGAIRHNGFIPWDDDIDVVMPRDDYDRLRNNYRNCFKSNHFLQIYETDNYYYNCYAKLRDINTTFVEVNVPNLKMNQGVFIDIFPMDYYYDENIIDRINRRIVEARVYEEAEFKHKTLVKEIAGRIARIIYPKIGHALEKRDRIMTRATKTSKYYLRSGDHHGYAGDRFIMPIEWFGDGEVCLFENVVCKIPDQYDLVLKHRYGDYMKLPPMNERVLHHEVMKFDSNKGFQA